MSDSEAVCSVCGDPIVPMANSRKEWVHKHPLSFPRPLHKAVIDLMAALETSLRRP